MVSQTTLPSTQNMSADLKPPAGPDTVFNSIEALLRRHDRSVIREIILRSFAAQSLATVLGTHSSFNSF